MRHSLLGPIAIGMWVVASGVRADEVHLVGGTQLEGKATRHGDKVVVEMESGQITLSADGVERIERGRSNVERYQELASKLKPNDVQARLSLADFCRDHDMRAHERELLHQVIEIEPNQAQARARLGYVKTDAGWITRDEQLRAQGYVREEGQWVAPEKALELQRLRAQSAAAASEREKAQTELELKKVELQQRKLELDADEAKAAERAAQATQPNMYSYPYGVVGYGVPFGYGIAPRSYRVPANASAPGPSFPINGVRDPRAPGWPINGVRDPRAPGWPINGVRDPRSF